MAAMAALVPFTTAAAPALIPAYTAILADMISSDVKSESSIWTSFFGTKAEAIANEVARQVDNAYQKARTAYLIVTVILICKCFFQLGDLIVKLFKFVFAFIAWFFPMFIPWFLQFVTCTISKIMHLPQCFMWYGLDTAGWIFYLPFRLLFWILDEMLFSGKPIIVKAEHDMWESMYKFDNYVHDGLGTGLHLFHFPDSVTKTCYQCKIDNYPPGPTFPFKEIEKFIQCILTPF